MLIALTIFVFFIIPMALIGGGYYFDYKRNKKEFKSGIKVSFKYIALIVAALLLTEGFRLLSKHIFPWNASVDHHQEAPVPSMEANWKEIKR